MKTKRIPLPQAAISELEQLYATLPKIACKQKCQAFCGLIEMTSLEYQRIINRTGRELTYIVDLTCPCLDKKSGLCKVHDIRPAICRIFGLAEDFKCPHGCVPDRWLTHDEAMAFFKKVQAVSEKTGVRVASGWRLGYK